MPLFSIFKHPQNQILALWEITESHEVLKQMLSPLFSEENMEARLKQNNANHWLASRLLIQHIFENTPLILKKDRFNKPRLLVNNEDWKISITHSGNMAGIYVHKHLNLGLDLEKIDDRIHRVAPKFMNEQEMAFVGSTQNALPKTLIWSAKETLYKVYGLKELDFKQHLLIEPFQTLENRGSFHGNICKDPLNKRFSIQYQRIHNLVLTYTTETHE